MISNIETKQGELSYLDTFRLCISMYHRPVEINEISQSLWNNLQNTFIKNISAFDLYQMHQIVLLFIETPYLNTDIFDAVETELTKEYLEKIQDLTKNSQFNLSQFIEDVTKVCFAFALSRKGSQYFWSLIIKLFTNHKNNISLLSLENILFISYRLIDYLAETQSQNEEMDETMKSLFSLFELIEKKLENEKLIENNKIDPFNAMMPFSRFGNTNPKIWDGITKNILNVLNKTNQINPNLLNDVIFAFSNYYSNLIIQRDSDQSQLNEIKECYFLQNFEKFWTKIESLIISCEGYQIPHIANMIADLSLIDLELSKAWVNLSDAVKDKLKDCDTRNFVTILIGFSKKDFKDTILWNSFADYIKKHINEFTISELRVIVPSFLKNKETGKEIWKLIEDRFASEDILSKMNVQYFFDLQIAFAILGIHNDKIWQKFEEIVFKNLKLYEQDKDLLLNTLYSFSRSVKGSQLLWKKLCEILKKDFNNFNIGDLSHVAICLKSNILAQNSLDKILDKSFWDNFVKIVEDKLPNAKLNALNNLLVGMKENEFLKENKKLITSVEKKLDELMKDIRK